jgi:large repetitive protein
MNRIVSRLLVSFLVVLLLPAAAHAALTVSPITWNIVGLDSNDPLTGPNTFPVGARVCSNVATTNVSVNFVWDSANPNINLRTGSLSTIILPSIGAGGCADAYFEVEVTRTAAAFDTTRRYHITATDGSGTFSTVTPREIYVEHLISQSRNSVSDLKYGPDVFNLTSVPAGGGLSLVVGNTYVVQLTGGTATQGYNQFEEFINFSNAIFQILSVSTTYSANDSPFVSSPSDKLYADACGWENDPNSPNYRDCVGGDFKSGGSTVVTTYTIRIISGGGTSQTLGSLLYDFSGSSYHYNADYSTGARIANVIDPATATISKSFSPNPAPINGVSALTITLTNPNPGTLGGYNFVDNLPANMIVATPNGATTSGCGTPTLTATAGSSTISFSNGTLAANSNCVIKVNVTPTATGTLINTTNNLFVGTTDTGDNATANLTVNNEPPAGAGLCGLPLATWRFTTGFNTATPAATTSSVGTASAIGAGLNAQQTTESTLTATAGSSSWGTNGGVATGAALTTTNNDYFEFAVNTTGITSVAFSFQARRTNNGAHGLAVFTGTTNTRPETGTSVFSNATALTAAGTAWTAFGPITVNSGLNASGLTYFRIYGFNSSNTNPGSDLSIDNVVFTACGTAVKPTLTKSFSPDPIAVNGVSTLTFTLTNTNAAALNGATFTDSLPTGVQVAATPAASTTCTGGPTWAPTAGVTTLTFGAPTGGIIPASGSCTVSVNVTATTAGPHTNVSGFLFTTESGTTTTSVATDTLTAVLPPVIAKQFAPTPILPGGTSTLTFTITNPNQDDAIGGVAFSDTLPVAPGAMTVALSPNASTSGCGAPTFSPVGGAGSIAFTGGTIAGGSTCTVTVNVTASAVGTYTNISGNVSHVINAQTVNGNTATDTLDVAPPDPAIALLKQIGLSPTGPWSSFEAISAGPVYYRFTIENIGDVPLNPISLTDDTIDVSSCNTTLSSVTLPVAVAANDNHIVQCVAGPFAITSGSHTNTAHATGTFSGTPVNSEDSTATYATTGLTLDKSSVQSTFTLVGDTINYNYLVTNSGFAPLAGPVTVTDDKATVTCPAVTTVGDLDNFLDPGESVTCTAAYLITAGDMAAAFVTNIASASVDGVTSPTDSTTVFLSTSADVSIVKTLVTSGPFTVGQTITYTLFVANAGPSTATAVQVTDTPTNLTIQTVSGGGCAALPCTIPSLASGADATITVTATINAVGAFDNSATVSATQPDPDPTDNTDNTGNNGITGASADVSVVKTLVTAGPFTIGQSITYTLFVANAGPSTATNVQVTDTPSNLTITNVSGGGCAALPCTIPSLASGADATITVTATINAAGAFDNTATVSATEPDPDTTDNTDNTGNGGNADPSADISVVKTLTTAGPFTIGQSITYTLFVANAGPSIATSVQVTDTPANLTITNVSGGGCAALPCTIAAIGVGADVTITVTATINSSGAFDNSANVAGAESDPDLSNNTDNTGNGGTAAESADVSVVKTLVTSGPFYIGQTITYTIDVANAGPSTATAVQVTDTPSNLTITNVSGGGCVALPCTIPSLAMGASVTITVTATINATGPFGNSASVSATEPDPDSSNDTDNDGDTAVAAADLAITKTLNTAGPFNPGQTISYTLLVENLGPSTATNVQVTDTPSNLTIQTVSGGGCTALPCTIASLASGANASITVTATINAGGAFDNSATVSGDQLDPDSSNNTDNTGNGGTAAVSADLAITKTLLTAGPFYPGQTISYTLLVENIGPNTATNVQVTDTPSNLTITNVSGGGCAALPCTIASLASGANASITVTATIDAAGGFDNSTTVSAEEPDPDSSNNTDSTGNGGQAALLADLAITKSLNTAGPFYPGQTISYTLFVENLGPNTATNVQITDTPSNLTIQTVSGGGCAALPCTIPSLAPGANASITVTATINAAGAFDNTATVSATELDPDSSNNTDNTGNGGTAALSADVAITKTLTTAGPFNPGQSISYTLFVENLGPNTATNVQVTDTPTNLTITNVSGGGCAALPCTIASLASGANASINVTATINAAGSFDNSATVSATEPDPDSSNNTDNTGNGGTAGVSADVAITKTLSTAGPFTAGQTISYSLFVENLGPNTATNVQITDTPSNLTITNVSGGGCVALPCTIASLASGANASITVTATINAAGSFNNTVNVTATEPDPDNSNNDDNTGNGGEAGPSADVSVVKTLTTAGPFTIGQTITYTLFVANAGPSTATSVQVTDTPSNLTITNVSGGGCAALPCTISSLASGADVTITVTATIDAAGSFNNTATVSATEPDPDSSDNTDNTGNGGEAGTSANISIVKTLTTAGPFTAGDTITYTLLVANAGPSTATNIQVTDTPTNLTIQTVSGGGCAALPCTIASLAAGADTTITVTATITADGAFDNIATVLATEPDPDTTDNTDDDGNGGSTGVSADVSVVKTLVTASPFTIGDTITYTLLVANAGPSTATNVQVTDTPTNLTITNVSGGGCAALPCTIASLASGADATITVTATINAAGAFDNSATVTATEPDPDPTDNTDNTGNGGNADPSADVSIDKTLTTAGPFTVGDSITYSLLVANAGPSTATNIQVTDTPTNLTITNVSGGGCAALPCTIASLASGANATITVTATITAAGAFDNSATVTATEPDPDPSDNTDDKGNGGEAGASANISIVKTLTTAGPFTIGQSITYSLLVANAGPSTATAIQVTDTPSNLTITNVSGGGCAALPCTIASLASGADTTITVTATIDAEGAFDNIATVLGTEPDPDTTDNTDDDGNGGTTGASANVSLVKTLTTAGPFTIGDTVTYTLLISNAGPSAATAIQVTDTPTNLTITNVSGSGCAALPCTIPSLASGANTSITVTATINAEGAFDNVATATATEPDPDPEDNTDDTDNTGQTTPTADMSLVKTLVTAGPFTVGQSITYTLDVTNSGPSNATSVQVTDTPTNLTITNVSGGGCAALPCTIASMASGATVTITITATINADGAFDNSASVSATETETNFTNNTDSVGNGGTTGPTADMSLVKTLVTAGPFVPGQTIEYTLDVANAGPSIATAIQVTDTPTNLTITNVSGGGCAALPCTIPSLASGASVTINVTATINAAGAFDNSATVSATETETDFTNNTDNTGNGGVAAPTPLADLEITKTAAPAMVTIGQTLTFTLVVENHGPGVATGVTVTDPLPPNFTLIAATPTQGTCSGTTTVTCNLGGLALNASATITITGTVTTLSPITNTATITANETDPNPANNASTAGAGPQENIPTVSEIGLMLLAMMLGVVAILRMRA